LPLTDIIPGPYAEHAEKYMGLESSDSLAIKILLLIILKDILKKM